MLKNLDMKSLVKSYFHVFNMKKRVNLLYPLFVILIIFLLFLPTFVHGLLPIPSDTIIGLYHPYRDLYATEYPNGIPFKNFLITDPVRQIIPWKMLVMESWQKFQFPLWNPYEMAGKPLLANFQSGAFYPLNIILLIKNFAVGWTVFILLQQILGSVFFYVYIRSLKVSQLASIFGTLAFVFSGFFIAWLEWGTIIHTIIWLPVILLAIDKISGQKKIKEKRMIQWCALYVIALICSFFAGHLQTFFYLFLLSFAYFFMRWFEQKKNLHTLYIFGAINLLFILITSIQWIPTLQFILLSARDTDQVYTQIEGWFIPLQHLAQFVAPDFFGNPTTLNYWGTWNYGELVGYIGIAPLLFAIIACIIRRDKLTLFFVITCVLSLIFATHNFIAQLPFMFHIPFLSTAQPTRLLVVIVFSLAVLASFGFDIFYNSLLEKKKDYRVLMSFVLIGLALGFLWLLVVTKSPLLNVKQSQDYLVAQKNLILPTLLFGAITCSVLFSQIFSKNIVRMIVPVAIILLTVFDLLRFGNKFLPFTPSAYLFPATQTTKYLQTQGTPARVLSLNSEVLPPNFLTAYHIQTVEGYDPLYTHWYAQYVSALEKGKENANELINFNRIILPRKIDAMQLQVMNVGYVLTTTDSVPKELVKVSQEGQTRVFKNTQVYPRVFFVNDIYSYNSDKEMIQALFEHDLLSEAIVQEDIPEKDFATGSAKIISYDTNRVEIETQNKGEGFLVFSDAYYPTWTAKINGESVPIYRTNYVFRGILVPAGNNKIIFQNTLFKWK